MTWLDVPTHFVIGEELKHAIHMHMDLRTEQLYLDSLYIMASSQQ